MASYQTFITSLEVQPPPMAVAGLPFQPRVQIKPLFEESELVDNEAIRKFSEKIQFTGPKSL